jgi:hypothetical protein
LHFFALLHAQLRLSASSNSGRFFHLQMGATLFARANSSTIEIKLNYITREAFNCSWALYLMRRCEKPTKAIIKPFYLQIIIMRSLVDARQILRRGGSRAHLEQHSEVAGQSWWLFEPKSCNERGVDPGRPQGSA